MKVQDTMFKGNKTQLQEIVDKFKLDNLSKHALMESTKDILWLILTQEVEAQAEDEETFGDFINLIDGSSI